MKRGPDSSRQNVERILAEGVENGTDREALRNYLLNARAGAGNSLFHTRTFETVLRIKRVLGIPVTKAEYQRNAERKLRTLKEHRERGALGPHDFDLNALWQLNKHDAPLERKHMEHPTGPQAVVLTRQDFDVLGAVEFAHTLPGEEDPTWAVSSESLGDGDVFILYPWEVGTLPEREKAVVMEEPRDLKDVAAAALRDIFPDAVNLELPPNDAWNQVLAVHGKTVFAAVNAGRAKGVPEAYLRVFLFQEFLKKLDAKDYGFIARLLKNMNLAAPEKIAFFEMLAVPAGGVKV